MSLRRLGMMLAAFALLLGMTGVAYATPPQSVGGDFSVGMPPGPPTSIRPAGGNCIIEINVPFHFEGNVEGSWHADFRIVSHAPCGDTGPENFKALGTFIGTVLGVDGTFTFTFQGKVDSNGVAQGELTVLAGDGGLEGLHGRLTLTGQAGVGGTYTGKLNLNPA